MTRIALKFSLVFILLFVCRAQALEYLMQGPDSPDGEEDPYSEVDPAPIDDHLFVLLFAGLLLGIYFMMKRKSVSNLKT